MDEPLATSSGSTTTDASPSAAAGLPPPRPLSQQDQQTLSQLKRGNWSAIEELVARYQDRLFVTVLRMVGHPEDAADLVQETFVRAMQNVSKFEGKSSLYTWLFRIAINLSLSHRRSQRYRAAADLDGQAATLRRELAQQTEGDPAAQAEQHAEHERVMAALADLEADSRAVIILRDVEECDYEQMSQILEVPIGTVKSRLFRARAALREKLSTQTDGGTP